MQQIGRPYCSTDDSNFMGTTASMGRTARVAAALQILAIVLSTVSMGCSLCSSKILREIKSPETADTAFVVESDCGATVDYSRQVTLAHGHELPKPRWNEAVIEKGTIFRASGQPTIDVQWKSASAITIKYRLLAPADRVVRQDPSWDGISVEYVQLTPKQ